MRVRLREHSEVEGADSYEVLCRRTDTMPDHVMRTFTTAGLAASAHPRSLIDPACGDAVIPTLINRLSPLDYARLSDLSEPVLRTIDPTLFPADLVIDATDIVTALRDDERHYDMVVLTEVLEHLEDPAYVLSIARERADWLLASSPAFNTDFDGISDHNPEHVWMWDMEGYRDLLMEGNWYPEAMMHLGFVKFGYRFQTWLCR